MTSYNSTTFRIPLFNKNRFFKYLIIKKRLSRSLPKTIQYDSQLISFERLSNSQNRFCIFYENVIFENGSADRAKVLSASLYWVTSNDFSTFEIGATVFDKTQIGSKIHTHSFGKFRIRPFKMTYNHKISKSDFQEKHYLLLLEVKNTLTKHCKAICPIWTSHYELVKR